jgi:hypothetical protein
MSSSSSSSSSSGEEGGPYPDRPSCQRFEQWVLSAGKKVRGSKKREKSVRRINGINSPNSPHSPRRSGTNGRVDDRPLISFKNSEDINIFAEIFTEEDDLIWPLQLVDLKDQEQFRVLYPLMFKLPHVVMYYLNEIIFPEVLAHQNLKLSTCGQELGGEMLFGRRIGFSGTPSDILPLELGSCQYERGSDGKIVHFLTSPSIVRHVNMSAGWNAQSLLDYVATAKPTFHALIDTGALITGMSNKGVAKYLLGAGLSSMKGVVYLDELDRQMVLLRKGFKVVKLAESGLAWSERFTFYDQVHTTGMDIKQAVDACAAVTLGKDMVFRDYAQGTFRMRGIGKGQTLCLLVVPEIEDRIRIQVAIGAGVTAQSIVASSSNPKQYLQDIVSWLTINSMRVDGIQFSLLCEQSVRNIWRKRAFTSLLKDYRSVDQPNCSPEMNRSLQVFRERVDFEIENSVSLTTPYSEKIMTLISSNSAMLTLESDKTTASKILNLIRDEEIRSDAIKKQARFAVVTSKGNPLDMDSSTPQLLLDIPNMGAADAIDSSGAASEQSFNREQVQEQEQVHIYMHIILHIYVHVLNMHICTHI